MNNAQKIVLCIGGATIVIMVVIPPWAATYDHAEGVTWQKPAGYAPIYDPPDLSSLGLELRLSALGLIVDVRRLAVQIVAVIACVTTLLVVLHGRPSVNSTAG